MCLVLVLDGQDYNACFVTILKVWTRKGTDRMEGQMPGVPARSLDGVWACSWDPGHLAMRCGGRRGSPDVGGDDFTYSLPVLNTTLFPRTDEYLQVST